LSAALEHLHQEGLVHRDIKPSNIIFVNGARKLADIGLVADVDEARSFVGTVGFIPPEGPGTSQADVYSLGKVLYEMLTGNDRQQFPSLPQAFRGTTPHSPSLPDQQSPCGLAVDVSLAPELNLIILRACESDSKLRYSSAGAMREELAALQVGRSIRRT